MNRYRLLNPEALDQVGIPRIEVFPDAEQEALNKDRAIAAEEDRYYEAVTVSESAEYLEATEKASDPGKSSFSCA